MKKKFGAFGAGQFSLGTLVGGQPRTTIFQNPGGGGGGLGGVAYKDRARPPPRGGTPLSGIHHSNNIRGLPDASFVLSWARVCRR